MFTKCFRMSLLTVGTFLLGGLATAAELHGQGGVNANRYAPDFSRHSYTPVYSAPVRSVPVFMPMRPMMMGPAVTRVVPIPQAAPVVVQQPQAIAVSHGDHR